MRRSGPPKRRSIRLAPRAAVQKKAALARRLLTDHARDCLCAGLVLTTAFIFVVVRLSPVRAEALAYTAEQYRPIMAEQIDQSLAGARLLRERIAAGDLEGAKTAWIEARVGWERAEVFTSGFVPDLDREIDAWPNALLGFHAIEAKLFGAKRTDVQQETDAHLSPRPWT